MPTGRGFELVSRMVGMVELFLQKDNFFTNGFWLFFSFWKSSRMRILRMLAALKRFLPVLRSIFWRLKVCKSKNQDDYIFIRGSLSTFIIALVLGGGTSQVIIFKQVIQKDNTSQTAAIISQCGMPTWMFLPWNSSVTTGASFCRIRWCTPTASMVRHLEVSQGKYERKLGMMNF